MAAVLAANNPFPDAPANRTVAIFLDAAPPADSLAQLWGRKDEQVHLGQREIHVAYAEGMGSSTLKIPAAAHGTARNVNTIVRRCAMAGDAVRLPGWF